MLVGTFSELRGCSGYRAAVEALSYTYMVYWYYNGASHSANHQALRQYALFLLVCSDWILDDFEAQDSLHSFSGKGGASSGA